MEFENYNDFLKFLEDNRSINKSEFDKKLISTKFKILGLKIPFLRSLAKEIVKSGCENLILSQTMFCYYEEILVFGFVLAGTKMDEAKRISKIDEYINIFDNWSVVDSFCSSLKCVSKNKNLYFDYIKKCLKNKNDFIVRFGIVLLMDYYLDEPNIEKILMLTLSSQKESYYIQMAISWLIATSLAKNFEDTIKFLEKNSNEFLEKTKKMIVSKSRDSFRIKSEDKNLIKEILL